MKKTTFFAAAVLLAACSSEPMISDYDVLVHQNRGELLALYQRLNNELSAAKPSSELADNRRQYIDKVGRKIAEEQERVILNRLERDIDKHDVATLEAELANAEQINSYNREVYLDLSGQLQRAIDSKKADIAVLETRFAEMDDRRAPEKVALLDQIALIYGGSKAQETGQRRSDYIDDLFRDGNEALAGKRYERVQMQLDNLAQIAPDYAGLDDLKHRLIAAEYEQAFWDALSRGQTDRAYETYRELSQIPDYLAKNPDVVPSVEDMARYFIAEGNKRMGSYAVASAYQSYSRARYVKNTLGQQQDFSDGELKFIEFVDRRLQGFIEQDELVPAYGFLHILEEMNPAHPSLEQHAQTVNNRMLEEATTKIVPSAFTEVDADSSLGAAIVSRINQQLLADNKTRVRILEKNADGQRLTRSAIASLPNAASYYFLSGEILAAGVERDEQASSEQQTVLVSYQRVENPDYVAWTQLKKRDRKNTPEPPATIEVPVEETVQINKREVSKNAALSVTYRLAEAGSANVVFADAIKQQQRYSDESIDGIERGLFTLPAKKAELPTDAGILESLSDELAVNVATRLAAEINQLEQRYRQRGDKAVTAEQFNEATANYAYANVLLQAAGEQDAGLLEKLRNVAIRWKK